MIHMLFILLLLCVIRLDRAVGSGSGGESGAATTCSRTWEGGGAESVGDVLYGTAFRLSDFLRASSISDRGRVIRSMLMSYRLFRDHSRTRRDLLAVVIIDAPLPGRAIEEVIRYLRSVDVQFKMRYPDIPDTTPLYHYALRGMLDSDATSFVYIKSEALFLTDAGSQVLESMHDEEIACMPYMDTDKRRRIVNDDTMAELFGPSADSPTAGPSELQWCSSGLMFFKTRSAALQLLFELDASIRMVTSSKISLDIAEETGSTPASHLSAVDVGDGLLNAVFASSRSIKKRLLHHCEGVALVCQSCVKNSTSSGVAVNICTDEASLEILIFSDTTMSYLPEYQSGVLQNIAFPSNKLIFPELSPSIANPVVFQMGSNTCDAGFTALEHALRDRDPAHREWIAAQINNRIKQSEFSCELLSGFVLAVPHGDFIEYGSNAVKKRAEVWNIGVSNLNRSASISAEIDVDNNWQQFIMPRSFHIVSSDLVELSSQVDEYLKKYEAIPAARRYMHTNSIVVPCALYAELETESAIERNASVCKLFDAFKGRIYALGYIPSVLRCDDALQAMLLVGPHCAKRNFQRIAHLFRKETAENIKNIAKEPYSTGRFDASSLATLAPYEQASDPIGVLVADVPGHEFKLFEKPLDDRFVDLLVGRLLHKSSMQPLGANSYFIPFNNSKPRSLIEALILEHIAPIVVGDQDTARRNGFIGAEWWTQQREEDNPKEYHMDTAITWCRDAGWPKEFLGSCPYYPAVGSVVYLTDEGGPTVIFNQTSSITGLRPTVPVEIAAVFPKRNRMALFNGKRFHGVMKKKRCLPLVTSQGVTRQCLPRVTLLVNYWRGKQAGEPYTITVPQEEEYLRHYYALKAQIAAQDAGSCSGYRCHAFLNERDVEDRLISVSPHVRDVRPESSLVPIRVPRKFDDDVRVWINQTLPEQFMNALVDRYPEFSYADGVKEYGYLDSQTGSDRRFESPVSPAVLFELNESGLNEEIKSMNVHYWNHWEINNDGTVSVAFVAANRTAIEDWWRGMPGGNPFLSEES